MALIKSRNPVGRPNRSEIAILRARVWYCAVKARGQWKDSKLDEAFGSVDGPRKGPTRTRVFGQIRKSGILPRLTEEKLPNQSVVYRVANHSNFNGTNDVIESLFWDFLENPPLSLEAANSLVQKFLYIHNLTRVFSEDQLKWMVLASEELFDNTRQGLRSNGVWPFEASLQEVCKGMPNTLNLAGLFGALYRESCLSFNIANAETLGIYFRLTMEEFCNQPWLREHGEALQDISINRILFGINDYLPRDGFNTTLPKPRDFRHEAQGLIISNLHPKLMELNKSDEQHTLTG